METPLNTTELPNNAGNYIAASAVQMAQLGISTFPLHGVVNGLCTCDDGTACRSPGKHPRLGATFNGASADPAIVGAWFQEYHNINYGITTGQRIGQSDEMLVVVDPDTYKPYAQDTMNDLEAKHGPLPDTVTVQTGGGGRHLYYRAPYGMKFKSKLGPGVDFKGIGGYVVGPGSVHASGKEYTFEADCDLFEGAEIAKLPEWVINEYCADKSKAMKDADAVSAAVLAQQDIMEIKLELSYISADDYETWTTVLMALKSTGDEVNARKLAEDWSATSAKYNANEFNEKWTHGIRAEGGINIATISFLSREARIKDVDISAIMAKAKSGDWPEPQPLVDTVEAKPYPMHALPQIVREAVIEVQQFVRAPMAMVANSALATLSLAAQALNDVERATMLSGPISLYFLTVADSGERKSTLDNFFSKPIQEYEQDCVAKAKPLIENYVADMAAWDATKKGLTDRIAQDVKTDKDTEQQKAKLRAHEAAKPAKPAVPRLIYSDTTPEALLHNMAAEWPSAGIISSEGGTVLGGHGMSKENQMRNLAAINSLWDGKPIRTDRRSSGTFTTDGRLTVAIQVQQGPLQAFFDNTGRLARNTGFLARFLVAWPESSQGTRLFKNAPAEWPKLELYRARIKEILNLPQPVENCRVKPTMLYLSPAAKAVWVAFHDEIEVQLGFAGELHEVRDVASKTADNAARMAALFHIMAGDGSVISIVHMESAAEIMRWHLNESLRLLNVHDAPAASADAAKIDKWLISYCKTQAVQSIDFSDALRKMPRPFRKKAQLMVPLIELMEAGRVKFDDERNIVLNPALLAT